MGAFAFAVVNNFLSVLAASVRTKAPFAKVWALSVRNVVVGLLGQIPMGWLMAQIALGVGYWATSVTEQTDKIFQLIRIDPDLHAPPVVTFQWNHHIAGDSLDEIIDALITEHQAAQLAAMEAIN